MLERHTGFLERGVDGVIALELILSCELFFGLIKMAVRNDGRNRYNQKFQKGKIFRTCDKIYRTFKKSIYIIDKTLIIKSIEFYQSACRISS